jgi:hypothetical protein
MPVYEIEHKWTGGPTGNVPERVRALVSEARNGRVPPGCRPVSVVGTSGKDEIHSIWEAPSEEVLESMYRSAGLGSTRTIRKVEPYFVAVA